MAGTILVSKGCGLPTSTIDFDYLIERIRAELMSKSPSVVAVAYEPLDEGGMTFITLDALDTESYRSFVEATDEARSKASTDTSFPARSALWQQLSELLKRDARALESH